MPTYSFRNIKTGEVFDKFMSMGDKDSYLSDNPDLESVMGAPSLVYSPGGKKPDDGFREENSGLARLISQATDMDRLSFC